MFVGHYAPALALKAIRKSPSLAAGFLAVQLIDIGFFSLSYFGIEKWRPNPVLPGFNPVDLYFMPYTHSFIGATAWAAAAGVATALLTPKGRKQTGGLIIGVLVLSHWFLDLIVHRHDLAIFSDAEQKLGYGLWDQPLLVMPLELGLLLAGFSVYLAVTRARGAVGGIAPWIVLTALFVVQGINWFAPHATDPTTFSAMGLAAYFSMAGLAFWLDRTRT
ncbi:MAG: hypothetical protein K8S25_16365 [Alphaproteobacteria bacterium]|nr:hypothetical protein [Alphaproteobacteria bacterium]